MQEYMDQSRTQQPLDVDVSMDSYIKAYHISHEDYQNSEETKHEEVQRKNKKGNFTESTKRDKRSPSQPDMIKFELGDAKNPDFPTNQETGRNLRMPFQISDAQEKSPKAEKLIGGYFNNRQMIPTKPEINDQSIDESRMIKITHPVMHKNQQRKTRMHSINDFPIAVQKAIGIVLREPNPTNGPSKITVTESENSYYGDKISKMLNYKFEGNQLLNNYPNKQWWSAPDANRPKKIFFQPNGMAGQINKQFVPSQPQPNIQYIFKETPIISNQNKEFQYTTVASRAVTPVPQTNKQFSSDDYTTNPYGPVELHFPPTQQTKFAQEDSNYYAKPASQEETGFNVHVVNSIQKPQDVYNYNSPSSTPSPRFLSSETFSSSSQKSSTPKTQYEFKSAIDEQNFNIYYASTQKPESQSSGENSYEREGSSIAALTALIGQTPSIQLQRLNELLVDGKPRPQDSTAPILFHPGQKPTMPQSPHLLPARPYAPDSFYKTPNNILYNNEYKPFLKDFTPIVENSSERSPNPLSAEELNVYSSKKIKDTRKVREVSLKKLSKNKLKLRGKRDLNYVANFFLDQTTKAPIQATKKIGFRNIRYVDRMLDYLRSKNNEFLKTVNSEISYPDESLSRKKRDLKNLGRSRTIFDNPFVLKPIVSKLTNAHFPSIFPSNFPQHVTFSELKSEGQTIGKVRLDKKGKTTTELRDPENQRIKSSYKDDLIDYNDYSFEEEGIVRDDFEYYDDKYPSTTKAPPTRRRISSNMKKRGPTKIASRFDYYDSWERTTKRYDYILGQPVSDLAQAIRKKVIPLETQEWVDSPHDNPYDPNYKLVPMTVYKKVPINEPILDKSCSNHGEIHIENLNIFHSKPKTHSKPKKPQPHHNPHHTSSKVIHNDHKKHHHDDTFNELYIPFLSYFPPGALGH